MLAQIENGSLPDTLKCTSLWALSKVAYIISRSDSLNREAQACLVRCLGNSSSSNSVRDNVYCALDELICCN